MADPDPRRERLRLQKGLNERIGGKTEGMTDRETNGVNFKRPDSGQVRKNENDSKHI
jgi:hypothetical protein